MLAARARSCLTVCMTCREKRETKSYQLMTEGGLFENSSLPLFAKVWGFNLCADKPKETRRRREKERERRKAIENWHGCPENQRNDGRGICYSSHSPSSSYSSFPLTPPLPSLLPLGKSLGSTSSSVLRPGLLEAAVVAPLASGKWRLLQTHKLPIWRGISGKGHYEPFLTHLANTEVSKVAEDRTSLLNKLWAWGASLYWMCRDKGNIAIHQSVGCSGVQKWHNPLPPHDLVYCKL